MTHSWYENTARGRIEALLDAGSFEEFLPAQERVVSPHLRQLGTPAAFDDGVIVGRGAVRRPARVAGGPRRRFHGRRGRRGPWR